MVVSMGTAQYVWGVCTRRGYCGPGAMTSPRYSDGVCVATEAANDADRAGRHAARTAVVLVGDIAANISVMCLPFELV